MQVYNEGSLGPSLTVHYNVYVEASMLFYSKGSLGPSIMIRYNG
jgi:hypothetical protein